MTFFSDYFYQVQAWIFEALVHPLLFHAGAEDLAEAAHEGVEWFLVGVLEIIVLAAVLIPLENRFPAQKGFDNRQRRVDFLYTAIHRLGIFSIAIFLLLEPVFDSVAGVLHLHGFNSFNLEDLWPGVTSIPVVSFFLYLVMLDFAEYWYHRGEHQFRWWWALHSVHHSQRHMNLWSDDRNHVLDDLLHDVLMATLALVIGVAPSQFILLIVLSRMLQSFQHANIRVAFGRIGEQLIVSPHFHRVHHGIGFGHESRGAGTLGGCNFAVLFPVWDIIFGTYRAAPGFPATGIRDQLPPPAGRSVDYGSGFLQQQTAGLRRFVQAFRRK